MPNSAVPLVRVERGGVEEGIQLGHIAVVAADGGVQARLGDYAHVTFFRSAAKPFQTLASLRADIVSRYNLQPAHVAIMSASHSGEPRHVEVVRDLLAHAGIPENALRCGAHWPYYEPAATRARRAMERPLAVFNNCSGKHAGMLAGAGALGAPLETYLDPDHPIQQRIREVIVEFTACRPQEVRYGVDGCSAPNAAVPLASMARSFARLVSSSDDQVRGMVEAMTTNAYLVGGTDRFDTRLMEVTKGRLLAKGGAAGVHCTADRRSGLGLAVKLAGGDGTWTPVAVMGALERLDWLEANEREALASFARPTLRNHNRLAVGTVQPILEFA